ncbi:GntR family transcriptional regulator [Rhodobacter sp. Har01]|uniref:GntR family transcriptional regulator n=1 Tax=Rhodobacter sp. Har01 TaxID=2883999 RepID=UPI001D0766E5|nr:GntR family transcriptional regulator [Rhodobacter sp. Har01]MCB6178560.1 GntR family transcriptional regulator [Rhodobacter sp. Har01]
MTASQPVSGAASPEAAGHPARTPLWFRVKSSLTALILDHGLEPNARLPSEAELCQQFQVSRTVVREALSQLVNEGVIYRLQGKGAFVRARRDDQDFVSTAVGFSGELSDKNRIVSRRILRQAMDQPGPRVRRYLKIDESEPVVSIDRVMMVDGHPRAIVRWKMVASLVPGLESLGLETRSLYDTLSRQYGIHFARADRWIESVALADEDARLLGVEAGRPALRVESVANDERDVPIEYYVALYLTDRSRLHVSVRSARI